MSVTNQCVHWGAPENFQVSYRLNSGRQSLAVQVRLCGYLNLVDEQQTGRFLNSEFENTIIYTPLHYQII